MAHGNNISVEDYARSLMKDGDVFTRGDVHHFVEETANWTKKLAAKKAYEWLADNEKHFSVLTKKDLKDFKEYMEEVL